MTRFTAVVESNGRTEQVNGNWPGWTGRRILDRWANWAGNNVTARTGQHVTYQVDGRTITITVEGAQ